MPTLNWIGREAVISHHNDVPYRLLRCDGNRSEGDPNSKNLIVEGDNLEALKALFPYYAGQVKCVYIDPPYNTGKQDWVYNDRVDSPQMRMWLGNVVKADDLSRHDKWLCMMYPRLVLLKQLMREDGVIWVSIDDTELANMILLLDEIFYPQNRLGTLVWWNATDNNPTRIGTEHEYVLCYAKDASSVAPVWKEAEPLAKRRMLEAYREIRARVPDLDDVQKQFRAFIRTYGDELQPLTHYNRVDERGPYTGSRKVHNPGKEGYHFDAIHPKTRKPCVEPARGYRFPESTYQKLLDEKKILFGGMCQ